MSARSDATDAPFDERQRPLPPTPTQPLRDKLSTLESVRNSSLYNEDLAPVPAERRTWGTYNYAALWIAMSVNIPTYMLASAMIAGRHELEAGDLHGVSRQRAGADSRCC